MLPVQASGEDTAKGAKVIIKMENAGDWNKTQFSLELLLIKIIHLFTLETRSKIS